VKRREFITFEEAPHGSATACDPVLVHRRDHLIQRQIRLLLNQREQPRQPIELATDAALEHVLAE
jgi:hypothetical protein